MYSFAQSCSLSLIVWHCAHDRPFLESPDLVPEYTEPVCFTYFLYVFAWTLPIFLQDSAQASHHWRHLSFFQKIYVNRLLHTGQCARHAKSKQGGNVSEFCIPRRHDTLLWPSMWIPWEQECLSMLASHYMQYVWLERFL